MNRTYFSNNSHLRRTIALCILICVFLSVNFGLSQEGDSWVKQRCLDARMNFAVPDAPGFKILEVNPMSVMRPASVQELALMVADFHTKESVLPKSFAAEVSLAMLAMGKHLTIQQYRELPMLYQTRVSVATRSSDENGNRNDIGIGLRFTIIDHSDPRLDDEFIRQLSDLAVKINSAAGGAQAERPTGSGQVSVPSADNMEKELDNLRERRKDSLWNETLIEAATAVRYTSSDSLTRNAMVDRYQAWLTGAFPISKWGQFLFNVSGNVQRNATGTFDSTQMAIGARMYIGSNETKIFAEVHLQDDNAKSTNKLLSLGGEVNIVSSIWIEFSTILQKASNRASVIRTNFNVRWSLPELSYPW